MVGFNSLRMFICVVGEMPRAVFPLAIVVPLNSSGKAIVMLHLMWCDDEAMVPEMETAV